jgi:hypothetical protein
LIFFDPMLHEVVLSETNKGLLTTAGETEEGQEQLQMDNRLSLPEVDHAQDHDAVPDQGGATNKLAGFIHEVAQQLEAAILPTLKKDTKQARVPTEAATVRRSDRLSSKTMKRGHKIVEEMAQELLYKKLV